jgi:hypothetical protein
MMKTRSDFLVGRAYQWAKKGCGLAFKASPWGYPQFDRDSAVRSFENGATIIHLLLKEIKEWATHNEDS